MNSEELEQSLRTEFESYLKNVVAEMRQEMSQLQEKIEEEIEKHKAQLDQVFQDAFSRVTSADDERELDAGFKDSVIEHLRLARDEGARITATAFAEAEEMEKQKAAEAAPKAGFAELREAINDISSKTSQSEILKSLVNHAANFAPRGAFFIVKNEHFVGWRKFGDERGENEDAVRDVYLPFTADSILSESIRSLATVESSAETYSSDAGVLDKLEFGSPEKMYAIPLVARGRGVAVLYADHGEKDAHLDTDALETLVKVAGLTVELLASAKVPSKKKAVSPAVAATGSAAAVAPAEEVQETSLDSQESDENAGYQDSSDFEPSYAESIEQPAYQSSYDSDAATYQPAAAETQDYPSAATGNFATEENFESAGTFVAAEVPQAQETYPTYEESSAWQSQPQAAENEYSTDYSTEINANEYSSVDYSFQPSAETQTQQPVSEYQFESSSSSSSAQQFESETSSFETTPQVETFDSYSPMPSTPQVESSYSGSGGSFESVEEKPQGNFGETFEPAATASSSSSATSSRTRFSDRNVDLPIEVTEDERRLHNDARRFARLLVSEIKLYNEQKVKEGREAGDLYERLREAIDRSREMYDKRVQSSVAAKFDYFHYELVNSLGEGEESRLGESYPGATV